MQTWRILLLPASLLYFCITWCRNKAFDWGIKKTYPIPQKSICIGNVTVGGTGKSPLVAFLVEKLGQKSAIVSRGYGRSTKGFLKVSNANKNEEIGDEPAMYRQLFGEKIGIYLAEKRIEAIKALEKEHFNGLVLLDDAFQHRAVKAGFSICCMTFDRPVFKDYVFPAGNLREGRAAVKRSDLVLVTKCPNEISEQEKEEFFRRIPLKKEQIFFSKVQYQDFTELYSKSSESFSKILLLTAIANALPLKRFLQEKYDVAHFEYPDHHDFTEENISEISKFIRKFAHEKYAIVTSSKDAVRLEKWKIALEKLEVPILIQGIEIVIDREEEFLSKIKEYVITTNERSS